MVVIESSFLCGKTVNELDLAAEIGVDIIAIRRGRHWHINPGTEIIIPRDILMVRGTASGLESLSKAAKGEVNHFG